MRLYVSPRQLSDHDYPDRDEATMLVDRSEVRRSDIEFDRWPS